MIAQAQPRALMILGPTASGKTALSLALARVLPVEIISVDSALIYRGMDIGSAKPDADERGVCPHHLIDICDIGQTYSAANFREDALALIDAVQARGRIPLIVGGTMLYAKALREGIDALPSTDAAVRDRIMAQGAQMGWPAMHERLMLVDPVTAQRLAPGDSQRIARALEVYEMTRRPLSSFHRGDKEPDPSILTVGLVPGDRALLHETIARRFDQMLAQGFVDEVKRLMSREDFDRDSPSMRCVGYRQAIDYVMGEVDYDAFVAAAKAATRQLAKRQMTWLRSMQDVTIMDPYADLEGCRRRLESMARTIWRARHEKAAPDQ